MARPRHDHPTPAELEVLEVLWERGPSTVRDVLNVLDARRKRAYTSVMSLLNVMTEKALLRRKPLDAGEALRGGGRRAFVYEARSTREKTLGGLAGDLVSRVFKGSASALVTNILDQAPPSAEELERIRETIDAYLEKNPGIEGGEGPTP